MLVYNYDFSLYTTVISACIPLWCQLVYNYDFSLYTTMISACIPLWCQLVYNYDFSLFKAVISACIPLWFQLVYSCNFSLYTTLISEVPNLAACIPGLCIDENAVCNTASICVCKSGFGLNDLNICQLSKYTYFSSPVQEVLNVSSTLNNISS